MSGRILVIDDDPASCELMTYFLKSLGYRVAVAPDGSRALNMNLADDISLVILDVHMPHYEGPEVLAMLRETSSARSVSVIAVTGDDSEEMRGRMLDLGIDGYLTKPLDLDDLAAHVSRLLPDRSPAESALRRRVRERGFGRRLGDGIDPRAGLRPV